MKTNVKLDYSENLNFSKNDWNYLLKTVKSIMGMRGSEVEAIKNSAVAKILAATPYFANCKNPDQIAVLRLVDLVGAYRCRSVFTHRPGQSLTERILPIMCFPEGDKNIIDFVIKLLTLISLNDHINDLNSDKIRNKYNPCENHIISFFRNKEELLNDIQKQPELVERYQSLFKTDILSINWWVGGSGKLDFISSIM